MRGLRNARAGAALSGGMGVSPIVDWPFYCGIGGTMTWLMGWTLAPAG